VPDLTGLPALDLAIGLAFIFFLLSTLAATIQEFIAAILGLRARTLEQGLRSMLEDPARGWEFVDKVYDHDLVRSLYRTPPAFGKRAKAKPKTAGTGRHTKVAERGPLARAGHFFWRTKGPSYLSPRAFALALLDTVAPGPDKKTIFTKGDAALKELPLELQKRLRPLISNAEGDVEKLRTNVEAWFDDTMARASGWYKRKSQIILIVIGIVLVPAINANAIKMGERMWKDNAVRAAVVAQAQAAAQASPTPTGQQKSAAKKTKSSAEAEKLNQAAKDVDKVVKVGIPIGWRGDAVPRGGGEIAMSLAGWALTILAISLGAPFWFDTLSRFARLRSSGKPESPLPASGSGKVNERVLTPPQTPPVVVQEAAKTGG
jgi:hypothetical protein